MKIINKFKRLKNKQILKNRKVNKIGININRKNRQLLQQILKKLIKHRIKITFNHQNNLKKLFHIQNILILVI